MIVTCNGCFDGLHPGHFFLIGFAYSLLEDKSDKLIVGINCDGYIKKNKRDQPFFNEQERIEIIESLGVVDEVHVFEGDLPLYFIRKIMPDIHCIGEEYRGKCIDEALCLELGIKVKYIPRVGGWSTSKIGKFHQVE